MRKLTIIMSLFCLLSCTRQTFENKNNASTSMNPFAAGNIETPTFDYLMGGPVNLEIVDYEMDVTYTIYTFNNELSKSTNLEVTDPETSKLMTFTTDLPADNTFGELGKLTSEGAYGLNWTFDIPYDIDQVVVRKQTAYGTYFEIVDLEVSRPISVTATFEQTKQNALKSTLVDDFSVLWGLNGEGDLFTVDLSKDVSNIANLHNYPTPYNFNGVSEPPRPTSNQIQAIEQAEIYDKKSTKLEDGSWSIAMDDGNNGFYTIGKDKVFNAGKEQYPVYYYTLTNMEDGNGDVDASNNGGYEIIDYLDFTTPRLEYSEGFLYLSTNRKIIQMIHYNDELIVVEEFPISDLDNPNGGDIVRTEPINEDEEPQWFLSTYGGLYAIEWQDNYGIMADKKNTQQFPFQPTSLAYSKHQSAGELWVADKYNYSSIYEMDQSTGSYERIYQLDIECSDLTAANAGTDYEYEDAHPVDGRFYELTFPSKYGRGTIVFEDMYPLMQDYDFNDLVIDFKYEVWYDDNYIPWGIKLHFLVRNVTGASYHNGFGFRFEGLKPEWVTSTFYDNDKKPELFRRNRNGVESGHNAGDDAVFMVFDDHYKYQFEKHQITVEIHFTEDVEKIDFYNGFDPFIFVDGYRELEIHGPGRLPTALADLNKFYEFHDIEPEKNLDNKDITDPKDPNRIIANPDNDYRGSQVIGNNYFVGFPWLLVMPHRFYYPVEEVPITTAYPKFRDWANMSQTIDDFNPVDGSFEHYEDWYSDKPGYQMKDWIVFD